MKDRNKILISALLAMAVTVPVFGGCNIVKPQKETYISEDSTTMNDSTTTSETKEPQISESIVLKTPDGKTVVDTSYVRLIDGVKPEMMRADYWIKEGNDKVLMTPEEITVFNKNNRGVITAKDKTKFPKLDEFEDTLDGKVLKSFLTDCARSAPKDPSKYYLNGKPTTDEYWKDLVALSNIDGIPETINVKFGFTTKRMTIRLFPTEDRIFEKTSSDT